MDKKLIGWTIILSDKSGELCRTYFKVGQEPMLQSCVMIYVVEGKTFSVEPEFGTPRKVLY